MPTLILLRHGQSTWNLENRFTGTMDVDLTLQGELEASRAATSLRAYTIDIAYCSILKRAMRTLEIIFSENQLTIPVIKDAALNERNYGDLQGLNKAEMADKYGADQVQLWRRSYEATPPNGESLKDTFNRVVPYYMQNIEPVLKKGKTVLIVAHGNSLRALMMHLEKIDARKMEEVNIATGIPRVYEFGSDQSVASIYDLMA
jgi:2,3-bisphosphoglycerate-dependent phosphoglycerate mutase